MLIHLTLKHAMFNTICYLTFSNIWVALANKSKCFLIENIQTKKGVWLQILSLKRYFQRYENFWIIKISAFDIFGCV